MDALWVHAFVLSHFICILLFETLLNSIGGLTALLQLERKAEFHASKRDKA